MFELFPLLWYFTTHTMLRFKDNCLLLQVTMEFLLSVSKEVRVTGKYSTVHDLFQNGQHLDIFKRQYATIYKKHKIHTHTHTHSLSLSLSKQYTRHKITNTIKYMHYTH